METLAEALAGLSIYEVSDNEALRPIGAKSPLKAAQEWLDETTPEGQLALEVRDTEGETLLYVLAMAIDGEWAIESWTPDQHGPVDSEWLPVWQRQG